MKYYRRRKVVVRGRKWTDDGLDAREVGGLISQTNCYAAAGSTGRDSLELPVPRETIAIQKPSVAMLRVGLFG